MKKQKKHGRAAHVRQKRQDSAFSKSAPLQDWDCDVVVEDPTLYIARPDQIKVFWMDVTMQFIRADLRDAPRRVLVSMAIGTRGEGALVWRYLPLLCCPLDVAVPARRKDLETGCPAIRTTTVPH